VSSVGDDLQGALDVPAHGLGSLVRRTHAREVFWFAVFLAAYYLAYRFGMSFSQASASPFWFPDSILLCALLMSPPRRWWILVLATLPIRLFSEVAASVPLWLLLVTYGIDSAKGLVAAVALRHFIKDPTRLQTIREFAAFCLFAVLLVPAGSALAGAAALHALGRDYWLAWEQWFLGDALAQLVVTPAILYFLFGASWNLPTLPAKRMVEGVLLTAGLVVAEYLAFNLDAGAASFTESRFYAPVPFLFWAAIRFGMFGASGAIMVTAIVSVAAALQGRGPFSGLSHDGTALALQHFLLLRAVPLYLVAVLIEQRKGVERSLRESEERFRSMANAAPALIWTSGIDGLCDFFNQGWLDFTGRPMQKELGDGWLEGVHPEDREQCREVYQSSFDARKPFEMEYRLRRHDGEYRSILDKGVPRYAQDGTFVGYIGSGIDITDRKRAEEISRHLAHVQRLAVMGELTAMIAHEVSQPLTAIMSNADASELMLESPNPPLRELREAISDIRRDDLRASEAIRRIRALLLNRETRMDPLDLNSVVSDVLRLSAADAQRRRVRIQTEFTSVPALVVGDAVQLQQVLLNLIVNAMDAMEHSRQSKRRLTVLTKRNDDDTMEVAVADCGCGIAPERLESIFDSFFTTKKEGMGLGLSIARSIVSAHDGHIWAESNSAGGATFRFTVPVARSSADEANRSAARP
jgi:two-component system, LuxR family, sensor kinase FixL